METKGFQPFQCPVCRLGTVEYARVPYEVHFRGQTELVNDAEVMRCAVCEEILFAPGQSDALQRRAADAFRPRVGLLTGRQIVDFRGTLGLTQARLETAMGVPPKTVARWEIGSVIQSCAADRFLRVLIAHPELVTELLAQDRALSAL